MCPVPKNEDYPWSNSNITFFWGTVRSLFADTMIWVIIIYKNDTTIEKSHGNLWLNVQGVQVIVITIQIHDEIYVDASSVSIFAPLIKSIMLGLDMTCQSINPHFKFWARRQVFPTNGTSGLTFVNVTFGTMTVFSALGASLGDLFLSPPGWYWYLKFWPALSPFELPTCHGMLPSAILTLASDEAEVGLRPGTEVCNY